MARKRWATFSVADHLDLRSLVPDVLLFDRLAFPYPADAAQWRLWERNEWHPQRLDLCLETLGALALPFAWGGEQHEQFRTNMEQAERLVGQAEVAVAAYAAGGGEEKRWERAKHMTRMMVAQSLEQGEGADLWVMPSYRSRDAFVQDQQVRIVAANRRSRREVLAALVGHEMEVPDDAEPRVALELAAGLAQDETFQRARRELFNWQEDVVQRDQSSADDAQELADLMAKLHGEVRRAGARTRRQWTFLVLKGAVHALEIASPASWAGAAVEIVEVLTERKKEIEPSPIAAFQHVQRQVIDRARPRKQWRRRSA